MQSHYGKLIESLYPRVIGASLNNSVFCYKEAHFSASRTSVLWLVQHLYFLKTLFGLCTCLYLLCTCTRTACLCRKLSTAASRFIPTSLMIIKVTANDARLVNFHLRCVIFRMAQFCSLGLYLAVCAFIINPHFILSRAH